MSPADEKALLQEGIAAARAGNKASARSRFRELTAQNFDNELAWLWLASVADTPAHAIACLRRVLQITPGHEKARAALFRVLMESGIQSARGGDKATAFTAFTEASALDAASELAWTWMASTASSPRQALDALRRVLQLNPSHDQAGRAYRKLVAQHGVDLAQANDPGARAVLTEASENDPANETVWLWLARVVPPDESVEYYERLLTINPDHEIARAALEQLRPPPPPPPVEEALLQVTARGAHQIEVPDFLVAGAAEADLDVPDEAPADASPSPPPSEASTPEEFLVYHAADVTTVWAPSTPAAEPRQDDEAHEAAGEAAAREDETIAASEVDSYVAASESAYAAVERAEDEPAAGTAVSASPVAEVNADAVDIAAEGVVSEAAAMPVPAPAVAQSSGGAAWTCPICLSAASETTVRCPTCGSVVTLVDPELLLDTDRVDRRHVLQVVARLKNRKVSGRQQFDHHFTLGLAYVNAGRLTEGVGHLRTASGLQPNDRELKAQIDTLEKRAAQRVKDGSAAPPAAPAPMEETLDHVVEPQPAYASNGGTLNLNGGENGHGHGPRRVILVVDDSPTIQKVVSVTLEAHGHEVVTASDGMEALSKLRTVKPDLVLLDITMPHMDGYQLCRILRAHELTKQVPIVMLSGKDGLFDKMRGRMAGAATYITKPFAPSALPPLVEKYCKRAG